MSQEKDSKDPLVKDAPPVVQETKKTKTDDIEDVEESSDTVKYSTHKRLLNQLKTKAEELESLRAFKREIEESEAKRKGDFETLLKSRESKIQELESKLTVYEKNQIEGQKLQAFIDKLPGKIKRQEYLSFVDLDEIALNPETNRVDETTLKVVIDKFVTNYSDLMEAGQKNTLPKVTSLGGRPNLKQNLKQLSREELRAAYLAGNFKE